MPNSPTSWPSSSTFLETRRPIVMSISFHTTKEAANEKPPMVTMPSNWVPKPAPPAMQAAMVPQMPQMRWAGMAPTTSSSFIISSALMPAVQRTPPTAPMMIAHQCSTM